MIVAVPFAKPVTVSVVATPVELLAFVIVVLVGVTVAIAADDVAAANVPDTLPLAAPDFTVAVNVSVLLFEPTTVPLVALNVIVGVAFDIEQLNVTAVVLSSLHLYPLDNVAVIVYVPAFV